MTIFENIKTKNIDELAEWLDKYCTSDTAPWFDWWDENYCKKCEGIMVKRENGGYCYDIECSWCELNNHKCKFFKELDEIPDGKQIIKMWLESEYESEVE